MREREIEKRNHARHELNRRAIISTVRVMLKRTVWPILLLLIVTFRSLNDDSRSEKNTKRNNEDVVFLIDNLVIIDVEELKTESVST